MLNLKKMAYKSKKAQITIFIVLAILIAAVIGSVYYFQFRTIQIEQVPEKLQPPLSSLRSCMKQVLEEGTFLLGQQAGYLEMPETIPSSSFMPFTNKQEFLGREIPYWQFISGNNLEISQVPSQKLMERQLASYIEKNIAICSLTEFVSEGFEINKAENVRVSVNLKDEEVIANINLPLNLKLGNVKTQINSHKVSAQIPVVRLYNNAVKIMNAENEKLFLEERTIDMIFLYEELPSTESTLECFPRSWKKQGVENNIKKIIANNIQFTKVKGTNYEKSSDYFELEAGVNDKKISANFISLAEPFKLEISGEKNGIIKGETLNSLLPDYLRSFLCLSNYQFVYDVSYPVLVVLRDTKTNYIFQFPFVVVVDNNQPRRNTFDGQQDFDEAFPEICKFKLADVEIKTVTEKDNILEPLQDVSISYKCINTICPIGTTSKNEDGEAIIKDKFPQCVNGFVVAEKEGYVPSKLQVSTNFPVTTEIILEPVKTLQLDLRIINAAGQERGLRENEKAFIFIAENDKNLRQALLYPEDKEIKLATGTYNVKIHLLQDKKVTLEKQSINSCVKVPKPGLLGAFGFKEEQCNTIEIPQQELEQIIFGGTSFTWQVEVVEGNTLVIYAIESPAPERLEELNAIYTDIETNADSEIFKFPEFR